MHPRAVADRPAIPVDLPQAADRQWLAARAWRPGAALLEGWSDRGTWHILLPWPDEVRQLPWSRAGEWPALLEALDGPPRPDTAPALPFTGGWVGFVAYDAGALLEGDVVPVAGPPEPAAWFARHQRALLVDPAGPVHLLCPEEEREERLRDLRRDPPRSGVVREKGAITDSLGGGAYALRVEQVREAIARGDVYQVNLTRAFRGPGCDAVELYLALTAGGPGRCSALLRGDGWAVASASPEVFLVHDRVAGTAESRPIKGTIARGGDDDAEREALLRSAKDAAEHVMIVDLVRNDLGKVAPPGRVSVTADREVLTLAHVHHLESTVRADGLTAGLGEVFRALFPGGSITGAPKRAAVRHVAQLETGPRGVYTGAIGMVDARGRSQWSVAIRTAVVTAGESRYHAGGGIVWDSDAALEDAESRAKSVAFLEYFQP